ncbi:retrotransposable element [Pimephales promelas]|nr:retrotransposable element [Pimephales promelas]
MGAASASATSIEEFVHHSIQRMNSQEKEIGDTGRAVQALVTQVSELTQQIQRLRVPAAPPTPAVPLAPSGSPSQSEPRLPVPEAYSGEPSYCRAFLTQCSMHFALQPRTFYNEQTKVAFVLTLLTGRAALWGTAVWENQNPCCSSFQDLSDEMKKVFDRSVSGREAARTLAELRQGRRSVSEFSIEFRTLAAECGWNEEAQWDMFLHGLADHVQNEIYALDLPTSLNGLIDLALRVDARLSRVERRTTSTRTFGEMDVQRSSGRDVVSPVNDHEPMQVGRARLSREERERRRSQGLCLYCGGTGHYAYNCPEEAGDLPNVPAEYLDLKEVFSKSRAASLPPHRPYDCAIDLLPAVFQALVNDLLRDMIDQFIYVYLDDILIFSSSLQEHVQHVRRVLQRLLENGLFVKAEKCDFHAQSVPFLGYIVSSEGMRMDPEKIKAVVDWPSPDSRKALLRWSDSAEAVFAKLKSRFVSAPILITPDSSRQFVVEVDASEVGVGAVLSQRSPVDDKMHPCAFFSHRLSPAKRNYDIGNRELLAVKLALEEWRHWLEGSGVPFIVWTDHKNLEYIRTAKRLNSRQARWALFFGRFDFTLSYRPGSKNIKPDALSRIFDFSDRPSTPVCILPETIFVSTLTWEIEAKVKRALEGVTPPPGCPPNRLFVPEGLRSDVIQWGHSSNVACHPGVTRTGFSVKQRFWWPRMARDIHDFVLACSVCAIGKSSNQPPDGLLQPLPVPSRPWSHIALDFITALPPSQGNTVILTVVDRFSKAAHFIPLPKLPSAKETAVTIVDHVFRLHGLPMDVVSDRGPQFVSKFWREFCKLLGATVSLSSGFHPQSNGQTERANQDVERTLRCMVSKNPSSWSQQLSMVEYAHNTLPVSSTGLSPFECSVGYQPPIFPSLESEVAVPSAHAFIQRCHRTWTRACETLLQVGARTKAKANRHRRKPLVYVIVSPVAVRLQLPLAYKRIHPVFHVSKVKPVFYARINPPVPVPPPPRLVDGEPSYSVNRILDSRRRGRGFQYLVDWEGYGPEERSWVPARDILDHSLIDDYNRQRISAPPHGYKRRKQTQPQYVFASEPREKMVRPCSSGCGRFLSSSDGHERCFVCLGFEHARTALVDDSCSFCGNMTIATLRSRLNDLTVRVPASVTRSASSSRGSSSARRQGDLTVTVWNKNPTLAPRATPPSAVLQPESAAMIHTSASSDVPSVSFGAPEEDATSIAASKGWLDSSGSEDAAALPPSGVPVLPVSDPEMTAMLSRAAVNIVLAL